MFLLHTLLLIAIVYWGSALIAETVMTSNEEYALAPAIRLGFGFFIVVAYFSAAWMIMPLQQAWMIGLILFACYGIGCWDTAKKFLAKLKQFKQKYLKTFVAFLLGSTVFFAPLIISNNYGPFTEGGGDISIYADSAKYLQDNHLTATGQPLEGKSDLLRNLHEVFSFNYLAKRWDAVDKPQMNPPTAEYGVYRITRFDGRSEILNVPTAIFSFLSSQTNYAVYFAVQAFLYLCMLAGVWYFFRPAGVKFAALATMLVMTSYGILSVSYNNYALQMTAIAVSALILAILPNIKLFSKAGFRTYGMVFLFIWLYYIHYFAVLMPLIVAVMYFDKNSNALMQRPNAKLKLIAKVAAFIFVLFWLFAVFVGSAKSIHLADRLFATFAGIKDRNAFPIDYLGQPLSFLSFQVLSFVFGFLSQQHFYPLATESTLVNIVVGIGIVAGLIMFIVGACIVFKKTNSVRLSGQNKFYFVVYLALIFTVVLQLCFGHSSLYTQAKGAQNVLVYLYVAMLLPLVFKNEIQVKNTNLMKMQNIFKVALVLFILALLTAHIAYTARLAFNQDRGVILESSYFSEAKKITQSDLKAFVLFEPRKSADTYISIQPFFTLRMVPTRYLALNKYSLLQHQKTVLSDVLVSDLISTQDLSHLWTLNADCKMKPRCVWKAEKLLDQHEAKTIMLANDYERNFDERALTKTSQEKAMFSYMRNGSVMLFLPQGDGDVNVTIQPQNMADYAGMLNEASAKAKNGEFGKVNVSSDGENIYLNYHFVGNNEPSLKLIVYASQAFFVNVKLNNRSV